MNLKLHLKILHLKVISCEDNIDNKSVNIFDNEKVVIFENSNKHKYEYNNNLVKLHIFGYQNL